MLSVAVRYGVRPHAMRRVASLPFSSERQLMATTQVDPDAGREVLMVKGAVERVLDLCTRQMAADGTSGPLDAQAVLAVAERLAGRGMRVLATAVDREPDDGALERLADGGQRRGARPHRVAGDARPAPGDRAGGGDHLPYGGARTSR